MIQLRNDGLANARRLVSECLVIACTAGRHIHQATARGLRLGMGRTGSTWHGLGRIATTRACRCGSGLYRATKVGTSQYETGDPVNLAEASDSLFIGELIAQAQHPLASRQKAGPQWGVKKAAVLDKVLGRAGLESRSVGHTCRRVGPRKANYP